ncbi:MAG: bifunctional pyr operon transcriptional regulator/uracil phosphoribosyltransferase PyrR [Flavobacteriales bacterium]|nr:bifunctional pyr operon transcriptional regulator/uracil phosphoribosyltransferase PyrR [Flavobacteriales bacterium]
MRPATLIDSEHLQLIIQRLCYQLIENHDDFSNSVFLALQPRGVAVANRICETLKEILPESSIRVGSLDITFHRDDFRRRDEPLAPNRTKVDFLIEDKKVILVDDVLYTGRTIRAGLDAMLSFGRPSAVELLVLVERRFSRELPISPNYIGKSVDSYDNQRVEVRLDEKGNGKVLLSTTRAQK